MDVHCKYQPQGTFKKGALALSPLEFQHPAGKGSTGSWNTALLTPSVLVLKLNSAVY